MVFNRSTHLCGVVIDVMDGAQVEGIIKVLVGVSINVCADVVIDTLTDIGVEVLADVNGNVSVVEMTDL